MGYALPEVDADAFTLINEYNATGTPERRLLLGLLERAILDFVGNDQLEIDEAASWIFANDDSAENSDDFADCFSFTWVCEQLDLDSADIREKIRLMPKRGASKIPPWYAKH